LATGARALEEAAAREKDMREDHERQVETARENIRDLARRLEDARTEKAVLEGALDTTRREFATLSGEKATTAPLRSVPAQGEAAEAEETALLRRNIVEIGAKVTRLVAVLEEQAGEDRPGGAKHASVPERIRALQNHGLEAGAAE
jgi:hypothetical protein